MYMFYFSFGCRFVNRFTCFMLGTIYVEFFVIYLLNLFIFLPAAHSVILFGHMWQRVTCLEQNILRGDDFLLDVLPQ